MWRTPKTNWTSSDIVSLEDWQRWVDNGLYLHKMLSEPFEWRECSLHSKWDIPYYDVVNNLELNLQDLQQILISIDAEYTPELWYPVRNPNWSGNPSYVDFNRWETFELAAHKVLASVHTLYSGTFTAGQSRVRQSLGRCDT